MDNIFNDKSNKAAYVSGDAVWITDIKTVRKLEKECGKKFNFFGRVMYYNNNSRKYLVEFKTKDNQFESFWVDADKLSTTNKFNDNTIGYYMYHYDLQAVLDYEEFTKTKNWYKKERAKSYMEGIAPIDTTNGAKKGY